ncbi:MAG: hypothetical protein V2A72_05080 [Candidatus Omnitrophota bacterium]
MKRFITLIIILTFIAQSAAPIYARALSESPALRPIALINSLDEESAEKLMSDDDIFSYLTSDKLLGPDEIEKIKLSLVLPQETAIKKLAEKFHAALESVENQTLEKTLARVFEAPSLAKVEDVIKEALEILPLTYVTEFIEATNRYYPTEFSDCNKVGTVIFYQFQDNLKKAKDIFDYFEGSSYLDVLFKQKTADEKSYNEVLSNMNLLKEMIGKQNRLEELFDIIGIGKAKAINLDILLTKHSIGDIYKGLKPFFALTEPQYHNAKPALKELDNNTGILNTLFILNPEYFSDLFEIWLNNSPTQSVVKKTPSYNLTFVDVINYKVKSLEKKDEPVSQLIAYLDVAFNKVEYNAPSRGIPDAKISQTVSECIKQHEAKQKKKEYANFKTDFRLLYDGLMRKIEAKKEPSPGKPKDTPLEKRREGIENEISQNYNDNRAWHTYAEILLESKEYLKLEKVLAILRSGDTISAQLRLLTGELCTRLYNSNAARGDIDNRYGELAISEFNAVMENSEKGSTACKEALTWAIRCYDSIASYVIPKSKYITRIEKGLPKLMANNAAEVKILLKINIDMYKRLMLLIDASEYPEYIKKYTNVINVYFSQKGINRGNHWQDLMDLVAALIKHNDFKAAIAVINHYKLKENGLWSPEMKPLLEIVEKHSPKTNDESSILDAVYAAA